MKPIELEEHKVYKGMFYLKWTDGVLSEDFYNLARATDILNNYDYYRNLTTMQGVDPFPDRVSSSTEARTAV